MAPAGLTRLRPPGNDTSAGQSLDNGATRPSGSQGKFGRADGFNAADEWDS
jgi:hypothetical protein